MSAVKHEGQLAIMSEAGQDLNDRSPRRENRGGFFMTAAEDFDQNSPSPRAHQQNSGKALQLNNQLSDPRHQ